MTNNYLITPYSLFSLSDLKLLSKMILSEIISLSKLHGYCYASNTYFSKLYMATSRTVSKSVSELRDKGYDSVEINKNYTRKIKVNFEKLKQLEVFLPETVEKISNPNEKSSILNEKTSIPPEKSSTNNNNYNNKYNNSYNYNDRKTSYDIEELMRIK